MFGEQVKSVADTSVFNTPTMNMSTSFGTSPSGLLVGVALSSGSLQESMDIAIDSNYDNLTEARGEINVLIKILFAMVKEYALKYGLDSHVVENIQDTNDDIALKVTDVSLSSRVCRPSVYLARVLNDKILVHETSIPCADLLGPCHND